jgi:DNA-binding beta-propeller fold protein YncE
VFFIDRSSYGHIAQVASVTLTGQPGGVAAEPSGRFIYVGDGAGVRAFSINSQTGALTSVPLSSAITTADVSGLYIEPSGKYLYVATSTSGVGGALYGYTIHTNGTLTAVSSGPVATPNLPSSMVFSADVR